MDPDEIDVELPIPPSPDTVSSSEKPLTPQRTYSEPLRINIVKKEKEAREIPKENVKQTSPSVQGRASTRSPATSEPARSPSRQKREEQADEASDTQLSDNDEVSVEMPLIVETKPRARAAPAAPAQRPLAQVPIEVPKKEPPSWTRQIAPAQCVLQRSSVQKSYDPDEVDVEIDVVTSPTTSPPTESIRSPITAVSKQSASSSTHSTFSALNVDKIRHIFAAVIRFSKEQSHLRTALDIFV
ncbi:hypothetical protein Y032_0174g464 [Ancylostoma ceylanicum]|nr:hypothetical protein Y032_0174g464 [Ancylostoma ceylanicum]